MAPIASLAAVMPPPAWLTGSSLIVRRGDRIKREQLRENLTAAGYVHVPQVTEHGEFALRGSLIDIYPMGSGRPYRLDLFDDEIDSLRVFSPDTQRSSDSLEAIRLLPAREFPFDETAIRDFRRRFRAAFPGDLNRMTVYRDVTEGIAPGGIEAYLPLFFDGTATFFDYVNAGALLCFLDDPEPLVQTVWNSALERHEQLAHDIERPILEPAQLFLDPERFAAAACRYAGLRVDRFKVPEGIPGENFGATQLPPVRMDSRSDHPQQALEAFLDSFDGRALFTAESAGRRELLKDLLSSSGRAPALVAGWQDFVAGGQSLGLCVAPMEDGFVVHERGIAVIPESALLGDRPRQARRRRRRNGTLTP